MWSLGKVFDTPEVVRVYLGSLWDKVKGLTIGEALAIHKTFLGCSLASSRTTNHIE